PFANISLADDLVKIHFVKISFYVLSLHISPDKTLYLFAMHKKLLFLLMLFSIQYASGQEMWGISNSNYSGNMGIFLNPSTIVGAPYRYELNVLAGDFFAENTYVYFPKEKNIVLNG